MYKKMFSTIALAGLLLAGSGTPGQAELAAVGPIDPNNGYPFYYEDATGLRLQPCLNVGPCLQLTDVTLVDPTLPFPENYDNTWPDEAFYWTGDASLVTTGGGQGLLIMALEAAFAADIIQSGDQIVFGRIRLRIDNLVAGQEYTITTPYGIFTQVAEAAGVRGINFTEDLGIVQGEFTAVLNSKIGPFLTPTGFNPDAPVNIDGVSYISDGSLTTINPGPSGAVFRVEGPGVGVGSPDTCGDDCVETELFAITGQIATNFGVRADRTTYNRGLSGNGRIDIFASTVENQIIRATTEGGPTIRLVEEPIGSGRYFGRFGFNATRPLPGDGLVTLTNQSDTPNTVTTSALSDIVTVTVAKFDTTGMDTTVTGTLTVRANTSDNGTPGPTLTVFSENGTLIGVLAGDNVDTIFPGVFPTSKITVTSSVGGTATQDVLISGPPVRFVAPTP